MYPHVEFIRKGRWESSEHLAGVPDFIIERVHNGSGGVLLKHRTSAKPYSFDTIADAKQYVSDVFGDAEAKEKPWTR